MPSQTVIKRIAADCAYIDERGGAGIGLKPAADIVREYGEQFRATAARSPRANRVAGAIWGQRCSKPFERCLALHRCGD
jgi:hypothetical protein